MYSLLTYKKLTVIPGLKESIKVYAERLEPETPFTDAGIICMRGFFIYTIWAASRALPLSPNLRERQRDTATVWTGCERPGQPKSFYKITGLKRFAPVSLKGWMKNENYKKQALSSPDNLHHNTWLKQRVMIFFATCEQLRGSRRLIVGTGNISTLNALHGQ